MAPATQLHDDGNFIALFVLSNLANESLYLPVDRRATIRDVKGAVVDRAFRLFVFSLDDRPTDLIYATLFIYLCAEIIAEHLQERAEQNNIQGKVRVTAVKALFDQSNPSKDAHNCFTIPDKYELSFAVPGPSGRIYAETEVIDMDAVGDDDHVTADPDPQEKAQVSLRKKPRKGSKSSITQVSTPLKDTAAKAQRQNDEWHVVAARPAMSAKPKPAPKPPGQHSLPPQAIKASKRESTNNLIKRNQDVGDISDEMKSSKQEKNRKEMVMEVDSTPTKKKRFTAPTIAPASAKPEEFTDLLDSIRNSETLSKTTKYDWISKIKRVQSLTGKPLFEIVSHPREAIQILGEKYDSFSTRSGYMTAVLKLYTYNPAVKEKFAGSYNTLRTELTALKKEINRIKKEKKELEGKNPGGNDGGGGGGKFDGEEEDTVSMDIHGKLGGTAEFKLENDE